MKKTLLFLIFFLQFLPTIAQNPADVEHFFGAFPGFDGVVYSTVVQPDGKIIVSGEFSAYQGINASRIIRLNPDGSKDFTFNTKTAFNNSVYSTVLQSDGKIIVSGSFTTYQGVTENRIIRLNPDGSKDSSFISGTGFNAVIYSLAIQSDGKIIAAGGFTSYQGTTVNKIIRLNSNGSKDTSFNSGTGFTGFGIAVNSIAIQADGKIIAGGSFMTYQNLNENYIIRLNSDGSKDNSFNSGNGFNEKVLSIVVQPDAKIIIGGNFTTYQNTIANHIIRLNPDGNRDSSFSSGTGFNNAVNSIVLKTDGKILAGGTFTSYQTITENKIICLNNDGTKDSNFNAEAGFNGNINAIDVDTEGKIIIGGDFTDYKNGVENRIIKLNNSGTKEISFNTGTGFNGNIRDVLIQPDGKIIVGGNFTAYKGLTENRIIRLNSDGTKDTSFHTETGFDNAVGIIRLQSDGKIIVEGAFTSYKGIPGNNMIRLNNDGSNDPSFNIGTGFNDLIQAIEIQSDGKIIVGGTFTTYQNSSANSIIRLNSDGSKDNSFNSGAGFKLSFNTGSSQIYINSAAIQPDGKILLAGYFDIYNNVAVGAGIIRLNTDGTRDSSFITGKGFSNAPSSIAIQNDGKIILGGRFNSYQNITANMIIRLNTNGSKDTSFNEGKGFINSPFAIATQNDGKIILGGNFTNYQGKIERNIIRLNNDGSKDISFNIGTGFDDRSVYAIRLQSDGKIIAGGNFRNYQDNNGSAYLIRLNGNIPSMIPVISKTNISCKNDTGSASIKVSGGKSPYTYLWSNGGTSESITGLIAGDYSCTITDADLTSVAENFSITTIEDTEKPTITGLSDISTNIISGCTATGVALGTPVTADNCSVISVTNDAPTSFTIGNTTVTWTVKDSSDNIAIATQIVTVKGLDAKVTNSTGILTATETNATYKWFECSNGSFTEIPNENKISFTPLKVGSYAVEITKNGCSEKSTCYEVKTLGTKDFDLENSLKLYPNPSKDFVTVEINSPDNTKLKIFDINGQSVLLKELKNGSNTINISHFSVGVYMFEISNKTGKTIKKVIKK